VSGTSLFFTRLPVKPEKGTTTLSDNQTTERSSYGRRLITAFRMSMRCTEYKMDAMPCFLFSAVPPVMRVSFPVLSSILSLLLGSLKDENHQNVRIV
jgi:hypothetical protein